MKQSTIELALRDLISMGVDDEGNAAVSISNKHGEIAQTLATALVLGFAQNLKAEDGPEVLYTAVHYYLAQFAKVTADEEA